MTTAPTRRRAGFTLVELLVAIGLALVITALTVAVLNTGAIESQRTISAADRVSGWLLTAKNRAKRDGRPVGVRFYRSPSDPNLLTEAQYIELPDPVVPNANQSVAGPRIAFMYTVDASSAVTARRAFYASSDATDLDYFLKPTKPTAPVQPGYLLNVYVGESVQRFRITAVGNQTTIPVPNSGPGPTTLHAVELTLASYPDLGTGFSGPTPAGPGTPSTAFSYNFGFQANPATGGRPLFGEPLMQLNPDAVIDAQARPNPTPPPAMLTPPATSLNVSTAGNFDILFAPSGQVLGQTVGYLALLIRDPNKPEGNPLSQDPYTNFAAAGETALVAVYTKTGAVATHPVVSAADPFKAVRDGINSGF